MPAPGPAARQASIRPVRADDLPALRAMLALPQVASGYFGSQARDVDIAAALQWNADLADAGLGHALLGTCPNSGTVVAYAKICDGQLGYAVAPAFWRHGLATALVLAVCIREVESRPQSIVRAEVLRENIASVRVLEKTGFRFRGLRPVSLHGRRGTLAMLGFELDASPRALA